MYHNVSACASFPMIPWSNRLRDARFIFAGQTHQLTANNADGTAIHGVARKLPWQTAHSSPTEIRLTFDSRAHPANFPFAYTAFISYRLKQRAFIIETGLANADKTPMPGGFGHHPYFVREIDGSPVLITMPCSRYYLLENNLPSAGAIPVDSRVDFRKAKPIGDIFYDDCLTGRKSNDPARLQYPAVNLDITLEMDAIYEHIVFYAPLKMPFYALEPVTNANDGFNLHGRGISGTGVLVLAPGQEKRGEMRFIANAE
jgi:aldose 1-epimerase